MTKQKNRFVLFLNIIFDAIVLIYTIPCILMLVLSLAFDESLGIVGLYNSLLPLLLFPAPLLLIVALISRRWGSVLFNLPLIAALILWYGIFFVPRASTPTLEEHTLSVMTYNARSDLNTVETLETVLRDADADIVSMQEIRLPEIVEQVADLYPYAFEISDQIILSRYPMDTTDTADTWESARRADAVRVEIDFNDTPLVFYNIHPQPPNILGMFGGNALYDDSRRSNGYEQLYPLLEAETGKVIIAGDFNATDRTAPYQHMTQTYHDTFGEVGYGPGLTFPQTRMLYQNRQLLERTGIHFNFIPALLRIDYIMHNGNGIRSLQAKTHYVGNSDHFPVLAYLGITPEK